MSSDPTLSLFTSESPSHPSHDGDTSTTPSSNNLKEHLNSDPTLSLSTSDHESPSHPSHDGNTSTTPSSNKEHLNIVATSSHSTTKSPPHPYHDGDMSIRISIRIYGGTGAAIILLALIIVAILAFVLQQRRNKKAVDKEDTNGYSKVYPAAGTEQYTLHVYTYQLVWHI